MISKMQSSILAVDIGNTSMAFAHINRGKVRILGRVKTQSYQRDLVKAVKSFGQKSSSSLDGAVICSVVPKKKRILKEIIQKELKIKVYLIGSDIKVPLKSKYNPKQIGQDRLVCAYAASILYGAPSLVVDLGTATTLDIVSKRKEYLGGIIVPGIEMSAESLFNKTALLPKIKIGRPKTLIGKDTQDSILSGIFYGYGEMIHGLINLVAKKSRIRPKIVVTGGYLDLMKSYIAHKVTAFDGELVFKGLGLLWEAKHEKV